MRLEEKLHIAISKYLKLQYPKVMFISEASGVRVGIGQSKKLKAMRSSHVHLDLYILEPRHGYHGLILELKAKNIYKKDGTLFTSDHLLDQEKTIGELNKLGYKATFAVGLKEALSIINEYLGG